MASDPDACIPAPLKDFVFDLHDSVRRSQVPSEQSELYHGTFREITSKYFASSPWPSPGSVASECSSDPLFLALYRELTHRHLHSVGRVNVSDRIDGWHAYKTLFDMLLAEAPRDGNAGGGGGGPPSLYLLPDWSFDILHEFVYQFQGFCQLRTSTYAAAAKHASSVSADEDSKKQPAGAALPTHVADSLATLAANRDAWAVETVLFYLHRLVAVGTVASRRRRDPNAALASVPPAFRHLGLFASVALSRLECLLGDYRASLAALSPIYDVDENDDPVVAPNDVNGNHPPKTPEEIVHGTFAARLSLCYHAGVSYLMLRRYRDATKILGGICSYMQRGFKTGQLRKLPGSEQFSKNYDRMIALLAILSHVCPPSGSSSAAVEESVARAVRDKHGAQLSKIETGEEGYEDLFVYACPKFVSPAVPDYAQATSSVAAAAGGGGGGGKPPRDAYRLQVNQFSNEMSSQYALRKLRSYMKLYTSISAVKLAAFNDAVIDEFVPLLLCYKHKGRQLERTYERGETPAMGSPGSASDVHYYVVNDMIHVDEPERARTFENYFVEQIRQNEEIGREVEAISTEV